jgi:hypothetical protein
MMMAEPQNNGPIEEALEALLEALYDLMVEDLCRHLLVELRQWMASNQGMLTHRHGYHVPYEGLGAFVARLLGSRVPIEAAHMTKPSALITNLCLMGSSACRSHIVP